MTQNLTKVILFVPETEALEGGLDRFNEIEKKISKLLDWWILHWIGQVYVSPMILF